MARRAPFPLVLAATLALPAAAQDTAPAPPRDRDTPAHWRNTRFNLRWAGSASNLSFITRYIAEGMVRALGRDTGYVAYGTVGLSTSANTYAVGEHEVDFAITTPPVTATLALEGKGYFEKAYPDIRAVAVYPQDDWVMCVANPDLGVRRYEEIAERKLPVRIATNEIGSPNGVAFLVEEILNAHGITRQALESWGGRFVTVTGAPEAARKVVAGEADLACHEYWKAFRTLFDAMPGVILPVSDAVMSDLAERFSYQRNTIPKDTYGPGLPPEDTLAVDYSDWVVLTNANLHEDLVYLATKIAVEQRKSGFEVLYLSRPEAERAADVPLKPELMWQNVGVPLHPGAARYYREAGLLGEGQAP